VTGDQRCVGADRPDLGGAARGEQWSRLPGQRLAKNAALSAVNAAKGLWYVVLVVDRLDRADRFAGAAVDALVGVRARTPS